MYNPEAKPFCMPNNLFKMLEKPLTNSPMLNKNVPDGAVKVGGGNGYTGWVMLKLAQPRLMVSFWIF